MANNNLIGEDSYYDQKGITAISNDNAVVPRDQAGNVIIHLTSSLLIIEAIEKNILAESVLPTLDTQFNYFKFPARTTVIDETSDLDLDLDLDFAIPEVQVADAEATAAANSAIPPLPSEYKPSAEFKIPAGSYDSTSTIDLATVTIGPPQIKSNAFVITQDVLDQLNALDTDTTTPYIKVSGIIKTEYINDGPLDRSSEIGFILSFGDGTQYTNKFKLSTPEDNIKKDKAQKSGVYITNVNAIIKLPDIKLNQTWQIQGWAEDSDSKRYHEILINDTYIKFEAGVE